MNNRGQTTGMIIMAVALALIFAGFVWMSAQANYQEKLSTTQLENQREVNKANLETVKAQNKTELTQQALTLQSTLTPGYPGGYPGPALTPGYPGQYPSFPGQGHFQGGYRNAYISSSELSQFIYRAARVYPSLSRSSYPTNIAITGEARDGLGGSAQVQAWFAAEGFRFTTGPGLQGPATSITIW